MSKIKDVLGKVAAAFAPPAKKTPAPLDRPTRIDARGRRLVTWPDEDLEDLEHPARTGGWIARKRVTGWLQR